MNDLERLAAGIVAAEKAGDTETVKLLGAEYRRLQGQGGGTAAPQAPAQDSGFLSTLGNAFSVNVDPILEGVGDTAEVFGYTGAAETLKGLTSMPEGYKSAASEFMNEGGAGYKWSALPAAAGEQIGQFAGSVASRAVGAGAGAALGSLAGPAGTATGAVVGGFAGPAAFEAMQVLGPVAKQRAAADGRTEVTMEDLAAAAATAAASGTLNALAPGAQGFVRRMFLEGATEAGQALITQTGETAGTKSGLDLNLKEAVGEGIIGGTSAGAFDAGVAAVGAADRAAYAAVGKAADALEGIRYDNEKYTDDDKRAADRLFNAANGDMAVLGNVDDIEEGTAKGAAKAALVSVREDAKLAASGLRALAKQQNNQSALSAINTVASQIGNATIPTPQSHIDRLLEATENHPDAQRLASLARQANRIQDFTAHGTRDIGGLSQYTRLGDVTDKRNTQKWGATAAGAGLFSVGGVAALAAPAALNRVARVVDKITNNRSRVKRFVESATRDGRSAPEIQGQTALDSLEQLRKIAKAEKAAQLLAFQTQRDNASPMVAAKAGKAQQAAVTAEATEAQKAAALAAKYRSNAATTDILFETDDVPEGVPYHEPYLKWKQVTGAGPATTLDVLEQLAREGLVGKDIPQRFREDIRSFKTDGEQAYETYNAQELVRQRLNPNYKPKLDPETDTDKVMSKLSAANANLRGGQVEFKAQEGKRRKQKLVAEIESAEKSLSARQLQGLFDLAEAIDSSEVIRADRFAKVNEFIPIIFDGNPALVELWSKKFAGLAGIGNDKPYTRKTEEQIEEEAKTEQFEKAKKQAVKRKSKAKKTAAPQPDLQPLPSETPEEQTPESPSKPDLADVALAKLNKPEQLSFDFDADPPSSVTVAQDAEEPKMTKPKKVRAVKGKADKTKAVEPEIGSSIESDPKEEELPKGKKKIADRVKARVKEIGDALNLARDYGDALEAYRADLPPTVEGKIEDIFYDLASDQMTANQVIEAFTAQINRGQSMKADVAALAPRVLEALKSMEAAGKIKLVRPYRNEKLKIDGSYAKDAQGKSLDVLQIEVLDTELAERFDIAKAVKMADRVVPQEEPELDYGPNNQTYEKFSALKDIDPSRVDQSFQPIFDFLNSMRRQMLSVNNTMLTQIEDALDKATERRVGTVGEQLLPKSDKTNRRDEGPMRTVAQMLFQLGPKGERTSTLIRQEWGAGANLRVYSKNGLAHTQAGDIMKGILRFPTKHKLGGEKGLDYIFHGIGNLLGYDKQAPKVRRTIIFTNDLVDDLVSFANDPFGRRVLKNDNGESTKIGKMVGDGEGFFQVLNAAHEVKSMVDFARARYKGRKKLTNSELLQDPKVRADLAANYETDFIVQLDASNNAYQIAGMTMGYEEVLKATGLLPREGLEGDVDGIQGADIYLDPARTIASRIPELQALVDAGLPPSKLRKIFKGPIGTYLYAAAFNSREKAFREALNGLRGDAPLFSIDGGPGLIPIPQNVLDGLRSESGAMFSEPKYDVEGDVKDIKRVRKRIVTDDKGKFRVETATGDKGKFKGSKKFDKEDEAISYAYEMDLYVRMNDELIRDMNTRYPQMREYLNFAQVVSDITKANGKETVNVPTKDGMMLEYSFKKAPSFVGVETQFGDKVLSLGLRTPDYKLAGRGLAAFMTHQNDAWALRETYKRMQEKGIKGFNPIHDSFGFHPSDASAGQETWVEVMQEIGSPEYNLFLQILEANGISLDQYRDAGGNTQFILGRQGVKPVPASSIPTALS